MSAETPVIPLVDLKRLHGTIADELRQAVEGVVDSARFIGGPVMTSFEREFAGYCEVDHCVGVGNCTDALLLSLWALGVGAGDEVVTVSHTFIATVEPIAQIGATPVLVDVLPDTMLIDPVRLAGAITPRTRAIIVVHLYGQPCDMDAVMRIAREHGVKVIEDAAQAHGARWRGRRVGGLADVGCFSFFPGKNLGAFGDAGAVVGNDAELMTRIRMLANHGRLEKYTHELPGASSRLDPLHAAVLSVKLRHLEAWNGQRRDIAAAYRRYLGGIDGLRLPVEAEGAQSVHHLYPIRVAGRDGLLADLKAAGILGGIHYPLAVHQQPAFASLGYDDAALPRTADATAHVLSLPMFPGLRDDEVARICGTLKDLLQQRG